MHLTCSHHIFVLIYTHFSEIKSKVSPTLIDIELNVSGLSGLQILVRWGLQVDLEGLYHQLIWLFTDMITRSWLLMFEEERKTECILP